MAEIQAIPVTTRVKRNGSPNLIYREGKYRLSRRGDTGSFEVRATLEGKKYRVGVGNDRQQAEHRFRNFIVEMESGYKPSQDIGTDWMAVARALVLRQGYAAKGRGIPFELGERFVYDLMEQTGFRCAVSGIAFSRTKPDGANIDPWAPSIDRIDNRQGYLHDNVRIVAIAANLAMNRWGYDMLLRLAKGVVRSAMTVAVEEA
jgi:hypothetical protein